MQQWYDHSQAVENPQWQQQMWLQLQKKVQPVHFTEGYLDYDVDLLMLTEHLQILGGSQ